MKVFTAWMRSRMSPNRDAKRKLRAVFWREWTRPLPDAGESSAAPSGESSALGMLSRRDSFILRRANALVARCSLDEPMDPAQIASSVAED